MPAASGAEAEVPVCLSVHWWYRSVVTWGQRWGCGGPVHMKTQPLFTWNQGLKKALQSITPDKGPEHCPGPHPRSTGQGV